MAKGFIELNCPGCKSKGNRFLVQLPSPGAKRQHFWTCPICESGLKSVIERDGPAHIGRCKIQNTVTRPSELLIGLLREEQEELAARQRPVNDLTAEIS